MEVFQRGEFFHKVIHDISLGLTLTSSVASSLLLSLLQRDTSLHGHERCAERLEPRRDATQRLALPSLLLVFSRTEAGLAASHVRSDRRAAVGFCLENVGLEREWVDKLVVVVGGNDRVAHMTHVEIGQICFGGYVVKRPPIGAGELCLADDYSHTRLRSLGEGGCPVGALPVNKDTSVRE